MPQNKFYNKVSDQISVTRLAVEQQCRCFVESGKGNTEGGRRLQDSRRQWHLYLFRWMCVTNSTAQTSTLHFIDLHQRCQWTNNTHFFGALFLNLQPYKVANLTENTRQIAPSLRRWKVANIFCKQGRNQTWSNLIVHQIGLGNLCTGLRETWFAHRVSNIFSVTSSHHETVWMVHERPHTPSIFLNRLERGKYLQQIQEILRLVCFKMACGCLCKLLFQASGTELRDMSHKAGTDCAAPMSACSQHLQK